MQEFTTPGEVTVPADDNVVTALLANGEHHPHRPALAYRYGDGFVDVSTAELVTKVRELAAGLISLGIEPGSRVCLFMPARIEFTYLDYAIWAAGCATVTIYETSSADQVEWIVGNSGAVAVVCGSQDQRKVYESVAERLPDAQHVLVVDDGAVAELIGLGRRIPQQQVDERIAAIAHDDLGTLVYTSGTTGRPKGCAITHGNLIWDTRQAMAALGDMLDDQSSTLAFLPLAHILARVVAGGLRDAGRPHRLRQQLLPAGAGDAGVQADVHRGGAPGVREGVQRRAGRRGEGRQEAHLRAGDRGGHRALAADGHGHARTGACGPSTRSTAASSTASSGARSVGGCGYALSGGAPLGERLGHFFDGAGLLILEGYGLTETTGGATVNTPTPRRDRQRRPAGAGLVGAHRRGRRGAPEGRPDLPRLLAERGRHGRGAVGRRLVLQRRHRRARRRWIPAHHRPQEGPHRHGRRQEHRAGGRWRTWSGPTA